MEEDKKLLTQEEVEKAKAVIEKLFSHLEIQDAFTLNATNTLEVVLDSSDNGVIIGYHGEILESLQLILSLLVAKELGRFVRVSLEVGDYKKNREVYLERLAMQTKDKVLREGREQTIPSLRSWERRVIHLLLQDDEEVSSESVGEGRDRVLVIKPKN